MFGRKKKSVDTSAEVELDAVEDLDDEAEAGLEDVELEETVDVDGDDTDEWDELDASQDWREDGPFDIDEVELDGDAVMRLDLGSLIITPVEGMELNLQADQASQLVHSALTIRGNSALEVAVFAAPASGGLARETRRDIAAMTRESGGVAEYVQGPFGTELRRQVPVKLDDGREGMHVSRMWLAEGPRWMLRGILVGEAAVPGSDVDTHDFEEFFHNCIVRRGRNPHAAGELIPMNLPEGAIAQPQA